MGGICAVRLDLSPLVEHVAADVDAARGPATPGGATITPEERDGIEKRAEAAVTAVGNQMLQIPHPCSTMAGRIVLRDARDTAKGVVKGLIDGPAPSQPTRPQPPREPAEPLLPPRSRGRIIEA